MSATALFWSLAALAFALGAVVGSFLNVVIYRVPAEQSVVSPGSRCPSCETPIAWYDNIPILSWIFLRARCRHCQASLSVRYPFIEALMGLLSLGLWLKIAARPFRIFEAQPIADPTVLPWTSLAVAFGLYFVFLAILVAITFVDLDHYLIPHEFTLPGIALGVLAAYLLNHDGLMAPGALHGLFPPVSLVSSIVGVVVGGGVIILLFYLYFAARGIQGLGGGDVTMMALMGAWLGWPALIFIFFAASIQGLIAAGLGALFGAGFLKDSEEILAADAPDGGDDVATDGDSPGGDAADEEAPQGGLAVPFGPFIALAGLQFFFVGEFLPDWLAMTYIYYGP